jgi:hypothetical protein
MMLYKTGDGIESTEPAGGFSKGESIYNIDGFKKEVSDVGDRAKNLLDPIKQLEAAGEGLSETFGFLGDRVFEMEKGINGSAEAILKVSKGAKSYEEAMKRAADMQKEISQATSRSIIASSDVLEQLELTSQATNVSTKDLVTNFTNAGFQMTKVNEEMETVANVAQKMGMNVGAVAAGVAANLKLMNTYNFQTGTEGLAKMVAKSLQLGINMEDVMQIAEKAFDPEQAINLASDLQRLGVTTSALLDPLKVMDLGQNNPEQLMKEITNITKGLTEVDKASGKVRILPGEQLRMREIAKSMGMPLDKLAEMTIKTGELDYKMSRIKFGINIPEESREMIAGLAQFSEEKKGFVVRVKNEEGEFEEKTLEQLGPEDIKSLEEQLKPRKLEDLAQDQLTVSQKMLKSLESIASGPRGALAQTKEISRGRRDLDKGATAFQTEVFKKDEKGQTARDRMIKDMEEMGKGVIEAMKKTMTGLGTSMSTGGTPNFDVDLSGVMTNFTNTLTTAWESLSKASEAANNAFNSSVSAPSTSSSSSVSAASTGTTTSSTTGDAFDQIFQNLERYRQSTQTNTPATTPIISPNSSDNSNTVPVIPDRTNQPGVQLNIPEELKKQLQLPDFSTFADLFDVKSLNEASMENTQLMVDKLEEIKIVLNEGNKDSENLIAVLEKINFEELKVEPKKEQTSVATTETKKVESEPKSNTYFPTPILSKNEEKQFSPPIQLMDSKTLSDLSEIFKIDKSQIGESKLETKSTEPTNIPSIDFQKEMTPLFENLKLISGDFASFDLKKLNIEKEKPNLFTDKPILPIKEEVATQSFKDDLSIKPLTSSFDLEKGLMANLEKIQSISSEPQKVEFKPEPLPVEKNVEVLEKTVSTTTASNVDVNGKVEFVISVEGSQENPQMVSAFKNLLEREFKDNSTLTDIFVNNIKVRGNSSGLLGDKVNKKPFA